MFDLSIIVVSYNTKELLEKCLESVVRSLEEKGDKERSKIRYEIIVVDNGSSDGSAEAIRGIRGIRVIENKKNLGFGAANNQAAKIARGEYLLFLNSDTEVLDNGIEKLIGFSAETGKIGKIGVIGGKLLNTDRTVQPSAGRFFSLSVAAAMMLELDRFGLVMRSPHNACGVDWVSGACMLVRKEIFDISGGFDEGLYMYFEEVEWQYRLYKSGFFHYYFPGAKFIHAGGASSDRGFQALGFYAGLCYFFKKHRKKWQYGAVRFMVKLKSRLLIYYGKLTGNNYLVKIYEKIARLEE